MVQGLVRGGQRFLLRQGRFNYSPCSLPASRAWSSQPRRHASIASTETWEGVPKEKLDTLSRSPVSESLAAMQQRLKQHTATKFRSMAMWTSSDGKDLNTEQIIDQLPVLPSGKFQTLSTAIFFVTPNFAHLFEENSNFLSKAANRIWPVPFEKGTHLKKTIVAIVDALPAQSDVLIDESDEKYSAHPQEGIALCLTPIPYLRIDEQKGQADPPLVTFSMAYKDFKLGHLAEKLRSEHRRQPPKLAPAYSASVANTLFINGRKHTMYLQKWERINTDLYRKQDIEYLSELEIPVYSKNLDGNFCMKLVSRLFGLTKPAKIISSMGNILRRIEGGDSVISASQELEAIVPLLVKAKHDTVPTAEIRVYALVYPARSDARASLGSQNTESSSTIDDRRLNNFFTFEGARLHRVTSGGAGWGKKAGLLSLDPISELNKAPRDSSASSFFRTFGLDDGEAQQDASVEDDLLPEGHLVQFLAGWYFPPAEPSSKTESTISGDKIEAQIDNDKTSQWENSNYFETFEDQQLYIGNTTYEHRKHEQSSSQGSAQTIFQPNRFGLLTTSATGLSLKRLLDNKGKQVLVNELVHSTIMDAPDALFMTTIPAGGKKQTTGSLSLRSSLADPRAQKSTRSGSHKIQLDPQNEVKLSNRKVRSSDLRQVLEADFKNHRELHPYLKYLVQHRDSRGLRISDLLNKTISDKQCRVVNQYLLGLVPPNGQDKNLLYTVERDNRLNRMNDTLLGNLANYVVRKRNMEQLIGRRLLKRRAGRNKLIGSLTDIEDADFVPVYEAYPRVPMRKLDHDDPRIAAHYQNYRAQVKQDYKDYKEQRARELAPMREARHAVIKVVRDEQGNPVFGRESGARVKQETFVISNLLDNLVDEEKENEHDDKAQDERRPQLDP